MRLRLERNSPLGDSHRRLLGSHARLDKLGEENIFKLTDDVFLTQRDVRELQFAKASIATGWTILCREFGIEPSEIAQVLLAGSFGSYLSAASAVRIGLVPKLPLPRIVSAGNVAGAVRRIRPYALDVSSSVEVSKGIKDAAKIAAFIGAVKHEDA